MRRTPQLSILLATTVVAFAGLAGTASANMAFGDSATGLALTGDAGNDLVEVWSAGSVIVATADDAIPPSCLAYSGAWEGCDLHGTSGRTLDIDLGDGDNDLEFMTMPSELGAVTVTTGSGQDTLDLTGEGGQPAPLSTVSTGAGDDLIDARNHVNDTIDCGPGAHDTVYTDASPVLTNCEHVFTGAEADARLTQVTWAEAGEGLATYTNHHYLHAIPVAGSLESLQCRTSLTGWQPCGAGQDVGPVGGFPEDPDADDEYTDSFVGAVALGRDEDGALGLIDLDSVRGFVFDYTAPTPPRLVGALPTVADGREVGWWPLDDDYGREGFDQRCSLDGGAVRSCDASDGYWGPVRAGDHVLVARLRDRAGNLSAPLTLRWHATAPSTGGPGTGTGGPHAPVVTPPKTAPVKLTAPKKGVKARHRAFSVTASCPAGTVCRAKVFTLKFRAHGKTVKTKGSITELAGGKRAKVKFKLSRKQAKALGHRTVKATITAPGVKPLKFRLRG
jgi:hypothetical protein